MAPVSTSERDYLEQDSPVRGQNYVCLSFLSPEDAISSRGAYAAGKFLGSLCEDLKALVDSLGEASMAVADTHPELSSRVTALRERHPYALDAKALRSEYDAFVSCNSAQITREYSEACDGAACVRGIKVRGCYETMDEARRRCESLKRADPNFSVYVAEVGCWCPWAPDPDELANAAGDSGVAQYSETALNTLMQKYQENVAERDKFYTDRKRALMGEASAGRGASTSGAEHEDRRSIMAEIEAEDGWSQRKLGEDQSLSSRST